MVNGICVGWNAYLSFVKHKVIISDEYPAVPSANPTVPLSVGNKEVT